MYNVTPEYGSKLEFHDHTHSRHTHTFNSARSFRFYNDSTFTGIIQQTLTYTHAAATPHTTATSPPHPTSHLAPRSLTTCDARSCALSTPRAPRHNGSFFVRRTIVGWCVCVCDACARSTRRFLRVCVLYVHARTT